MPNDALAAFFLAVTFIASWYNWWKAMGNLVFESEDHYWQVMMLGGFAGRDHFTDAGWDYRNRSLTLCAGFLAYSITPILLSP